MPTFIDLFAGAGGFSEGFLQVEYDSKYYDFLLASDINTREILREMDLLPYEDCHPMGLSGGQKQRVAVASAIASERPLILFDEPTSGLDLFHMRQIANVVNQVANAGRTALVVTHDPEFILRCCNYVLHLENGQIQESYSIENSDGRNRLLKFFLNDMEKEVSTK